jgi:hypothetical protein
VLKRIFGPKREEGGSRRKLHNGELHGLYSSPNVVRVIKSRMTRWAGHVAGMREERGVYRILVGRPEGNSIRIAGSNPSRCMYVPRMLAACDRPIPLLKRPNNI